MNYTEDDSNKKTLLKSAVFKEIVGIVAAILVGGAVALVLIHNSDTSSGNDTAKNEAAATSSVTEAATKKDSGTSSATSAATKKDSGTSSTTSAATKKDSGTSSTTSASKNKDSDASYSCDGWREGYSSILQHISDNTLSALGLGSYGFDSIIYKNLKESGEQFEYALVDLDGDNIPELVVRANTSSTTYFGMSYWIMFTCKASTGNKYKCMPIMKMNDFSEGAASSGGSRVSVTMNDDMNKFFISSGSSGTGEYDTYIGYIEYSNGTYNWCEKNLNHYTYQQWDALGEETQKYPVQVPWKTMSTELSWGELQ